MDLLKLILAILLSLALGLVFMYSGYTKLLPVVETFEFSFVWIPDEGHEGCRRGRPAAQAAVDPVDDALLR